MNNIHKTIFLVLAFFAFSYANVFSTFGVKLGLVSSNFKNPPYYSPSEPLYDQNRIGPTMGIFMRYCELNYLDLESELFYIQKGGEEEYQVRTTINPQGTGELVIYDIHFDYLHLQTNIRPQLKFTTIDIYGIIGLSINYLLGVKNGLEPKSNFKNFIFSYSLGAGIELNEVLGQSLLVEFLINSDLSNISKNSDTDYQFQSYILRFGIAFK